MGAGPGHGRCGKDGDSFGLKVNGYLGLHSLRETEEP